jgi:rubrerythrin
MEELDKKTRDIILASQKNEITEHVIYSKLSQAVKDKQNKEILKQISDDEKEHYDFWKEYTNKDVKPDRLKIWWYYLISRIFGITFGIKLMERGEKGAQTIYERISEQVPSAEQIVYDEDIHEQKLVNMIDEERLKYISSIVLGLNDALVELTGALAGFTLALQNTNLIGVTGLITGIAASLSMGASEYLSTKSEETEKKPSQSSTLHHRCLRPNRPLTDFPLPYPHKRLPVPRISTHRRNSYHPHIHVLCLSCKRNRIQKKIPRDGIDKSGHSWLVICDRIPREHNL